MKWFITLLKLEIGPEPVISPEIVGIWSKNGCNLEQNTFKQDGSVTRSIFVNPQWGWQNKQHSWTVSEDTLTIASGNGNEMIPQEWNIQLVTPNHLILNPLSNPQFLVYLLVYQ